MDKEILIISSDETLLRVVREYLSRDGYKIISKAGVGAGLKYVRGGNQIILVSRSLPDGDGMDCLSQIKSYYPDSLVIMLLEDSKDRINAMKEGAFICLEKLPDIEVLRLTLKSVQRHIALKEEIERLRTDLKRHPVLISKSPQMLKVIQQVEKVLSNNRPVLITGEEGTGRELIARSIHLSGPRNSGPFITLNPQTTQSELAYYIKESEGGTLFIKGVDTIEPNLRSILSGLAKKGEFRPPEGDKPIRVNVRVIAGADTNPHLDWFEIKVPPLRRRREDILPLARQFLNEAGELLETGKKKLSKEVESLLLSYDWQGNVRELRSVIRKACIVSRGETIYKQDLILEGLGSIKEFLEAKLKKYLKDVKGVSNSNLYNTVISEVQKSLIELVLEETGGNQLKSAKILNISRNTISSKIREYRIKTKPFHP